MHARAPLSFVPRGDHRTYKHGFSAEEVAIGFGVQPRAVRSWIAKGWLEAKRLRNGRWLIQPEDVTRFVAWREQQESEE